MTLKELSANQIHELKESILCNRDDHVSYGELLAADELVSDEELAEEYDGYTFGPDDFFCSAGA